MTGVSTDSLVYFIGMIRIYIYVYMYMYINMYTYDRCKY
jgi:hypothetical protein